MPHTAPGFPARFGPRASALRVFRLPEQNNQEHDNYNCAERNGQKHNGPHTHYGCERFAGRSSRRWPQTGTSATIGLDQMRTRFLYRSCVFRIQQRCCISHQMSWLQPCCGEPALRSYDVLGQLSFRQPPTRARHTTNNGSARFYGSATASSVASPEYQQTAITNQVRW